jgi:hypothetical protein
MGLSLQRFQKDEAMKAQTWNQAVEIQIGLQQLWGPQRLSSSHSHHEQPADEVPPKIQRGEMTMNFHLCLQVPIPRSLLPETYASATR